MHRRLEPSILESFPMWCRSRSLTSSYASTLLGRSSHRDDPWRRSTTKYSSNTARQIEMTIMFKRLSKKVWKSLPIPYCEDQSRMSLQETHLTGRTAFKSESKKHPNYGKETGMNAAQWWENVSHCICYTEPASFRSHLSSLWVSLH